MTLLTVQQHILREQGRVSGAGGEFAWLTSGVTLATEMIPARVRFVASEANERPDAVRRFAG